MRNSTPLDGSSGLHETGASPPSRCARPAVPYAVGVASFRGSLGFYP
jgi:hypothetical protein